jgi:hypothetical protein
MRDDRPIRRTAVKASACWSGSRRATARRRPSCCRASDRERLRRMVEFAAIAHALGGRLAEAKARLDRARAAIAAEGGNPRLWQQKATIDVLRTEAEATLLDRAFPAEPFAAP